MTVPGNPIRPYRNKDDEWHFLELSGGKQTQFHTLDSVHFEEV